MTLQLYYAPGSCALASHIALEETGAEFEALRLDFRNNQQRTAEYLAINPKGRVPALVCDEGVLTETPAILAYVAQRFPAAALAPVEPFRFARAQSFNSYLCSTVHVAHAHRLRGGRWSDDPGAIASMQQKVPLNIAECFTLIEDHLLQGPWVLGAEYSICDPYLFTVSNWLAGDGVDIARFPTVRDHHQRMSRRPAVVRALATQQG